MDVWGCIIAAGLAALPTTGIQQRGETWYLTLQLSVTVVALSCIKSAARRRSEAVNLLYKCLVAVKLSVMRPVALHG